MKVRIYRWYNAVLTALLSMLGYGCEEPMDEYGVPVEYGVPSADYIVKGTVTDEAGAPIEGIKTVLKLMPEDYPEYVYGIDSTMTDAAGKFQIETRGQISMARNSLSRTSTARLMAARSSVTPSMSRR